jgi:predicted metal-binding membrane protein
MAVIAQPLKRPRSLLLFVLLTLAALGWVITIWQATIMDGGENSHGEMGMAEPDLTLGMAAPLFLAMWVAMMIAMMFPASAPMILAFSRSQSRRRESVGRYTSPGWFIAPYVVVWLIFGAFAYGVAVAFGRLAEHSMWVNDNVPRLAGGLLVLAGIYQLTPLKKLCLGKCRTPLSFMLAFWRDGRWGAVLMGMRHGLFCLGCCWVLFLVLLPLGVMNIAAMLVVAALVFAEKAMPGGDRTATAAAAVLIAYGLWAVVMPDVLPTMVV